MTPLLAAMAHHGYMLVFLVVFAEAIGLPAPAALALMAGGAAAASNTLHISNVLLLALSAMLLGDCLLFFLGKYTGWGLLGFLCKVSANPETCILRSAESFYKRGKSTLIFAKFIPGVNSMAPPLAGSMNMRPLQFLQFDAIGAALYVSAYLGVGFIFRNFLGSITRGFQQASHVVTITLLAGLAAYLVYKVWLYQKHKVYRVVPRVQVKELAEKLASAEKDGMLLVDVRSHGYYDSEALRMKGSVRMEPNNLSEELKELPGDRDIYLYCT
jgi:membrane protein DedA with SNARE-associated domain